jgi:LysM domain
MRRRKQVLPVLIFLLLLPTFLFASDTMVTIESGDSLWEIAIEQQADGYCWTGLYWKNADIENPNVVEPGQTVNIPEECVKLPKPIEGQPWVYRVEEETDFETVAAEHCTSNCNEEFLTRINTHVQPNQTLTPGTLIYLDLPPELKEQLARLGIRLPVAYPPPALAREQYMVPDQTVDSSKVDQEPDNFVIEEAPSPTVVTRIPEEKSYLREGLAITVGVASLASFGAAYYFNNKANDTYSGFEGAETEADARDKADETKGYDRQSATMQWVGGGLAFTGLAIYLWPYLDKSQTPRTREQETVSFDLEINPTVIKAGVTIDLP